MKTKVYVDAIRRGTQGYHVYTSIGIFTNVHNNIVETMFGSDLDYLLRADINSIERFRPLEEWEVKDLYKFRKS